jgi:hypothetical protein
MKQGSKFEGKFLAYEPSGVTMDEGTLKTPIP